MLIPIEGNPVKIPLTGFLPIIELKLSAKYCHSTTGHYGVSSSLWMAPAVFVRKKSGDIQQRTCGVQIT